MQDDIKKLYQEMKTIPYKDKESWMKFLEKERVKTKRRMKKQKDYEILCEEENIDYIRIPKIKKNLQNEGDK